MEASVTLGVKVTDLEASNVNENVEDIAAASIVSTYLKLHSSQGDESNDEVNHVE